MHAAIPIYLGRLRLRLRRHGFNLHWQQDRTFGDGPKVAAPKLPAPVMQLVGIEPMGHGNTGNGCTAGHRFLHDLPLEIDCRSEEHTSELQSLMRISYSVFCLKKKQSPINTNST